ncbi:MAG: sugar ABC transporter permease [Cellulomonas iranensis]|uniref:carbohydrate ABC transporter permease n=1 Tax=Cellulomonas iranensis TaxID=76862 RepID=UPI001B2AC073|nr:sugar ABC transporter permease [Cellulomonas iranensis]MBO9567980.1 sugar ABC transporter permease [Cellulomonas iranensis]
MTTSLAPAAGRAVTRPAPGPRRRPPRQTRMLFLLPAAVFLGLLSIYPLVTLLRMAVSKVTAATLNADWAFTGLENLRAGFESGDTTAALWRTAVFVVVVTVLGMGLGLGGAIALRTSGRWSGALLALMVFVWALPPVVNGSVWKFLLADSGLVNTVLLATGLRDTPVPFLYDQYWALGAVAFVNSFAVIPFNALVYRAALLTIDPEVFEAAQLDGATKSQQVRHIMVPSVRPTTLVLLILTLVYGFRSFDFIYVMTYGGPGTATNTLPFLGYLQAFVRYDYGLGAATSVVAVLGVLVLAVLYARSIRKEEAHG